MHVYTWVHTGAHKHTQNECFKSSKLSGASLCPNGTTMLNYFKEKLNNHSLFEFDSNQTLIKASIKQICSLENIKMSHKQSATPNKLNSKVNGLPIVGFQL